jgi:hypothetical protein
LPLIVLFGAIKGETVLIFDLQDSLDYSQLQSAECCTAEQHGSVSKAMNALKYQFAINFSEGSAGIANETISFINDDQAILCELIDVRCANCFYIYVNGMTDNDIIKLRFQRI